MLLAGPCIFPKGLRYESDVSSFALKPPLTIKTHTAALSDVSSGGFGLFYIFLPSLWSWAIIKAYRDKAFQVDGLHPDTSPPSHLESQQMADRFKCPLENIFVLTQ